MTAQHATDLAAAVLTELNSEDARAVLYGVTGTTPETYGGVTTDEALECAGELLQRLRALVSGPPGAAASGRTTSPPRVVASSACGAVSPATPARCS